MITTFILVSYKEKQEWLEKSLVSILNQSIKPYEIIHLDNDNNLINNKLTIFIKSKIKYRYIPLNNKSFTEALNIGIFESKGEIIFRQDPDDFSKFDRVEKSLKYLQNSNITLIGTNAVIINEIGTKLANTKNKKQIIDLNILKERNPLIHGSIAFKKSEIEKLGNYNESFQKSQDYELYSWLVNNNIKICLIEENLYYLRISKTSVSANLKSSKVQTFNSEFIKESLKKSNKINKRLNLNDSQKVISKKALIKIDKKSYNKTITSYALNADYISILKKFNINYFLYWFRAFIISLYPKFFYKIFF
jgi:glycosyltransferase EpsE